MASLSLHGAQFLASLFRFLFIYFCFEYMTFKKQQKNQIFKHASGNFQSGKISLVGTITGFLPYSTNP